MAKGKDGCVQPSRGPILDEPAEESQGASPAKEVRKMTASVGKPAPDFEASAFVGDGFENIRLSEYKGKWVALCFYPGDFTFV
jgi:AhpC/TSA family